MTKHKVATGVTIGINELIVQLQNILSIIKRAGAIRVHG